METHFLSCPRDMEKSRHSWPVAEKASRVLLFQAAASARAKRAA